MIDLPALTDPELASIDEHSPPLWKVRLNDKVYGPYFEDSLRAYAHANFALFSDADVCLLPSAEWQMYLQSKLKIHQQKTHTQLISIADLKANQKYFFQKNNLKSGPISFEEIKEMILAKELHQTDLVSSDDCLSWSKVYHFEELMAFCLPRSGLPNAPLDSTLSHSADSALEALTENESSIEDGLVGLAHFHQQRSGYNNLKLSEVELKTISIGFEWPTLGLDKWTIPAGVALSCLSLIVSVWWLTAPKPNTQAVTAESTLNEIEYTRPEKSLMNQQAPAPRLRMENNRRPASVHSNIPRIEARPFMDTRRDLVEYHDAHDYEGQAPEPRETMDAVDDPNGANAQYAQDQRDPDDRRDPANLPPDDGYRLAPVDRNQSVIEEVSDF